MDELLETIPWEKCRYIIKKTVIDGMAEHEVARELHMTLFSVDIEYLSKFIMLPREEAIQTLKIELINIVYQDL